MSATLKPGALARRAAVVADRHRRAGHPSPGMDPAVRAVLRVARSARDVARDAGPEVPDAPSPPSPARRRAPPGPVQLARMAARCPGDLAGLRDRALLLLAAARLDAECLLALDCEHVRFTAQGAALVMPGAGARAGKGGAVARMASTACPVRALQDWLGRSDTRFGPVFRKVDRWGNVEHRRLRPDALRRIWRRRAVARRPRPPSWDCAVTPHPALSTRQASRKTADAADQLLDWLKKQGSFPDGTGVGQPEPGHPAVSDAEVPSPNPPMPPIPAKCEAFARENTGREFGEVPGQERDVSQILIYRAERTDDAARVPLRPRRNRRFAPRHTDWLHHHLLVAGPAGKLADFQAAARGSGIISWQLDWDRMEEDLFLMLMAPPPPQRRRLSLAAARALAGQLRDSAEQRHAAAIARVGGSRACALDLHALVPVPPDVLGLGPDHPEALAWLWTHWGTTAALRHVAAGPVLPRRAAPDDPVTLHLTFWSADWMPWQALATVRARWPALRFDIRPTYGLL